MECPDCDGEGEGDTICFRCDGVGRVCDVCGEGVGDPDEDICGHCRADEEDD